MKNRFSKKIFISFVLIALFGIISAGCGTTAPPIIIPPATCTLTVYSQNFWCYGYVFVNGASTGQWIDFNGAVTISGLTPGTTATIQIFDNFGAYSHPEYVVLTAGTNMVVFTYWW